MAENAQQMTRTFSSLLGKKAGNAIARQFGNGVGAHVINGAINTGVGMAAGGLVGGIAGTIDENSDFATGARFGIGIGGLAGAGFSVGTSYIGGGTKVDLNENADKDRRTASNVINNAMDGEKGVNPGTNDNVYEGRGKRDAAQYRYDEALRKKRNLDEAIKAGKAARREEKQAEKLNRKADRQNAWNNIRGRATRGGQATTSEAVKNYFNMGKDAVGDIANGYFNYEYNQ